ncbi:MAG: hypothetical protein WC637_08610 [Victivallales bacterium]
MKTNAFLIDPKNKVFKFVEIDFSNFLKEAYEKLECSIIQPVTLYEDDFMRIILWVDEEGLLKENRDFFKFNRADTQWFAGSGMITCERAEGNAEGNHMPIDAKMALNSQAIRDDVSFMHCDNDEACPEPKTIVVSW